jgi:hypothetical protein
LPLVNNLRPLINTSSIGQFPSTVIAAIALTALLLTTQMLVQATSSAFVNINVQVDPFMTDLDIGVLFQPVRNLLWAPILLQFTLDQRPSCFLNAWFCFISSIQGHLMGLFWSVATLAPITPYLSAYGRFMLAYHFGDLGLVLTYFQQDRYLVSFFLGKLCVGSHECSFDLVVQEAIILPWLTSFSDRQSCTC